MPATRRDTLTSVARTLTDLSALLTLARGSERAGAYAVARDAYKGVLRTLKGEGVIRDALERAIARLPEEDEPGADEARVRAAMRAVEYERA